MGEYSPSQYRHDRKANSLAHTTNLLLGLILFVLSLQLGFCVVNEVRYQEARDYVERSLDALEKVIEK